MKYQRTEIWVYFVSICINEFSSLYKSSHVEFSTAMNFRYYQFSPQAIFGGYQFSAASYRATSFSAMRFHAFVFDTGKLKEGSLLRTEPLK